MHQDQLLPTEKQQRAIFQRLLLRVVNVIQDLMQKEAVFVGESGED